MDLIFNGLRNRIGQAVFEYNYIKFIIQQQKMKKRLILAIFLNIFIQPGPIIKGNRNKYNFNVFYIKFINYSWFYKNVSNSASQLATISMMFLEVRKI